MGSKPIKVKADDDKTKKAFNGVIKLDVRDSVADWAPYLPKKAPEGAPNILFVLYDDTGLAAWSPFGGRINMPTLQKLADRGLLSPLQRPGRSGVENDQGSEGR
jgi:hypothetical protein